MTTPYQKRQIVMNHQNTKRGRLTTVDQQREFVMMTSVYQKKGGCHETPAYQKREVVIMTTPCQMREVVMRHQFTKRRQNT
jgi:hypothetical protein